jgi:hypothetical protein
MTIKLDNAEFDCYDFEETNEGKNFSFKVDVLTKEEKESLVKLLTKKHIIFTKENGETIKATVSNNSHSYSLRDGQTEPDEYHFSISLEIFDREAEINKVLKEVDEKDGMTFDALFSAKALRKLLVEKGIITEEEFNEKFDAISKVGLEAGRKVAEELIDKKFES